MEIKAAIPHRGVVDTYGLGALRVSGCPLDNSSKLTITPYPYLKRY